jgi:hypothetical protein
VRLRRLSPDKATISPVLLPANRSFSTHRINFVSRRPSRNFLCSTIRLFSSPSKMAAFSRGLRSLVSRIPREEPICSRCLFSTTSAVQSGHSRWSKIKHDKGKADHSKGSQRNLLSKDIALASKRMFRILHGSRGWSVDSIVVYGGDPNTNPKLASLLVTAKKGT